MKFGVPQGSILGPTLFLTYINNLCDLDIPNAHITTFADDTAILFTGNNWIDVQSNVETGIKQVMDWLKNNLLTLNISKTKYINFSITNFNQPKSLFTVKAHTCLSALPSDTSTTASSSCNCVALENVQYIKYLGIMVDQHLTWAKHIRYISDRVRKLIFIFKKLRRVSDYHFLKSVYLALAQSLLCYCISVWGGAAKSHLLPLERVQRAILKVMLVKPFRFCTRTLYSIAQVLTVRQLYIERVCLNQHKVVFIDANNRTANTTKRLGGRRKHQIFDVVVHKTAFYRRQFNFLAPFLYNKINLNLNICNCNKHTVLKLFRKWIISQDYSSTEKLLETIK